MQTCRSSFYGAQLFPAFTAFKQLQKGDFPGEAGLVVFSIRFMMGLLSLELERTCEFLPLSAATLGSKWECLIALRRGLQHFNWHVSVGVCQKIWNLQNGMKHPEIQKSSTCEHFCWPFGCPNLVLVATLVIILMHFAETLRAFTSQHIYRPYFPGLFCQKVFWSGSSKNWNLQNGLKEIRRYFWALILAHFDLLSKKLDGSTVCGTAPVSFWVLISQNC